MTARDYQDLLEFSDDWLRLGVLTEEQLIALGREFTRNEPQPTEHFRYHVFREYLASHRPLPPAMAVVLYELGKQDPDGSMGRAMMYDIVELPECPETVRNWAAASGEKPLVRLVRRRRALGQADVNSDG